MFDDDQPDYFLANETTPQPTPTPQPAQQPATDGSNTIRFDHSDATPSAASAPAQEPAQSQADEPKPHRGHKLLAWTIAIAVVVIAIVGYFRYYSPYVSDARATVRVNKVETRGIIFKTTEADLTVYVADDDGQTKTACTMTVDNPQIANHLRQLQQSGQKAQITYQRFYATLPWLGESDKKIIAIN